VTTIKSWITMILHLLSHCESASGGRSNLRCSRVVAGNLGLYPSSKSAEAFAKAGASRSIVVLDKLEQ